MTEQIFTKLEAIKIGYRQTKEGDVVSFRIHPNDRSHELANVALGTPVVLAVAEIAETEPVNPPPG